MGGGERGGARRTFNGWEHVVQESKHERSPRHCQSTATSIVSSLCTRPPNLGLLDSNSSSLPSLVALPAWTVSSYSPLDGQEDEVPPVLRVCKVLDGTGDIQQPERVGERRECDGVEQRCYRSRYEDHLGWRREDGMRRERSRRCLNCSTVRLFTSVHLFVSLPFLGFLGAMSTSHELLATSLSTAKASASVVLVLVRSHPNSLSANTQLTRCGRPVQLYGYILRARGLITPGGESVRPFVPRWACTELLPTLQSPRRSLHVPSPRTSPSLVRDSCCLRYFSQRLDRSQLCPT